MSCQFGYNLSNINAHNYQNMEPNKLSISMSHKEKIPTNEIHNPPSLKGHILFIENILDNYIQIFPQFLR